MQAARGGGFLPSSHRHEERCCRAFERWRRAQGYRAAERCKNDLDDVPESAKKKLKLHFVKRMDEVLALALGLKRQGDRGSRAHFAAVSASAFNSSRRTPFMAIGEPRLVMFLKR